jgi:hypothetical protein
MLIIVEDGGNEKCIRAYYNKDSSGHYKLYVNLFYFAAMSSA